jgi:hypothetical protein
MRRSVAAVVVVALCTAPLSAELKINAKSVARQVAGAPAGNDVMAAIVGPMITQVYGGPEGIEMVVTLHEDGRVRTDYAASFMGMPAGSAVIQRADGTSVGVDVRTGTWWKMVDPLSDPKAVEMMANAKPEVTTKRTGEFATLAGLKAEHVSLTMQVALPLPPEAAQLPPQLLAMIPKEIKADGQVWMADAHAKYSRGMTRAFVTGPLSAIGLDKQVNDLQGLMLRLVMKVSLLAGYELETLVSKVAEEDVPDTVFEVPAGYKEIPMPTGSGKLPAV